MLHLSCLLALATSCSSHQVQDTAYRTGTGSAPIYFHSLLRIYIPSRSLRSASERHLMVPSQRGSKSLSRTFSFTVPDWWNDLPTPIRNTGSLSIFKQQLKTHLFQHYLTSSEKKKEKQKLSLSLFIYSLASLYLLEQCLRLGIMSTSKSLSDCLFKMNRIVYSPIVSRFG